MKKLLLISTFILLPCNAYSVEDQECRYLFCFAKNGTLKCSGDRQCFGINSQLTCSKGAKCTNFGTQKPKCEEKNQEDCKQFPLPSDQCDWNEKGLSKSEKRLECYLQKMGVIN